MGNKRKAQNISKSDEVVLKKKKDKKIKDLNTKDLENNTNVDVNNAGEQSVGDVKTSSSSRKPKKIIFVEDEPQEVPVTPSITVTENVKTHKKRKEQTTDILTEEDVKDEDIDKFCDELTEEDNKQYENWIQLIEANLNSNKKKPKHWVLQQDSAPAYRAKSTQDWLAAREIDFMRHEDCPFSSPDLNPLDYKIWQHLEEKACSKPHPNLESLKISLIKAATDIDMDLVRTAIDDWPR
ncbi:unnamed protein product [Parnassius mnemosyne]|uniref:Uncharacterized protein n=1 Tax=Parnassius mnemosyne TaxID=213953 RepID=A0AAV1KVR2_9NEOP